MSGPRRRHRGKLTALVAAALCTVLTLFTSVPTAAGGTPLLSVSGIGVPGVSLELSAGDIGLSTGLVEADLSNGANGLVTLTTGLCIPELALTCVGVLGEFSLIGKFKDRAGNPLYSDGAPAKVSWTCNDRVCPPTPAFQDGSTLTELQVAEFKQHTMYVALRNPNGTFQPFAPAPACHQAVGGAPLPTGTIDQRSTGGKEFCVDVGAISRTDKVCAATCSAWSGPLTLPVLFVEDPKFAGT